MFPSDWIEWAGLIFALLAYGSMLGVALAYAFAKHQQTEELKTSNRQLHHEIKLERIKQDNEHYIRYRDKTSDTNII